MKLTAVILTVVCMQVSASVYSQRISLSERNTPLAEVLKEIRAQSGYLFLYDLELMERAKPVTIEVKNASLETALRKCLAHQPFTYELINKTIVIKQKEKNENTYTIRPVQPDTLRGTVTDSTGYPLPGISVMVKGTRKGTSTDDAGRYRLPDVPDDATLVFSMIGFQTLEVAAGSRTVIDVVLRADVASLEEVVVVGYGTQKKVNLTGAVSTVNSEVLENRPIANVSQALQGTIPNLNITATSRGGELGEDQNWNIRGVTSLSGGGPYILVDNVPMNVMDVNPADIESITVLKDAASSAIYGSRAAYGVILITTKSGGKGEKVELNYSNNFSWSSPTLLPEMASSIDFAEAWNYAYVNSGRAPAFNDEQLGLIRQYIADPESVPSLQRYPENHAKWNRWGAYTLSNANVDWFPVWFRNNSLNQNHSLSVRGGSGKTSFYVSGAFLDQEGLLNFGDDEYNRYNLNATVQTDITEWFRFKLNTKFTRRDRRYPNTLQEATNSKGAIYDNIARMWPTMALYDPNGHIYDRNQILPLLDGGIDDTWNNFWLTLGGELEPVKDWKVFIDYSWNNESYNYFKHEPTIYGYNVDETTFILTGNPNSITKSYSNNTYYTVNAYSSYEKTVGANYFKLMLGYQEEVQKFGELYGRRTDLITDDVPSISTATSETPLIDDAVSHWATQGVFGRLNYSFREKYLAEINFRYDGSSRFEDGRRWGFFPSISAGYRISEEPFWGNLSKVVNDFKIRGSFGELGNQNVQNYLYISRIAVNTNLPYYINNGRPIYSTAPGLISSDLTWETSSTIDFGFDASLLESRLNVSFDWYKRTTTDMFGPAEALPAVIGAAVPQKNNASLETKGLELAFNWRDRINDKARYDVTLTLSDYTSVVTEYRNPTGILTTYREGQKLGEIWGYTSGGLFKTDEEAAEWVNSVSQNYLYNNSNWRAGDMRYEDLNGDGKIDIGSNTADDPGDRSIIGNSTPRYAFGLRLGLDWKGFNFSMFWQGIAKRDLALGGNMFYGFNGSEWNSSVFIQHLDYWTAENTDAYYPRPYMSSEHGKNTKTQTRYLLNGAYARLKNIQLGYTVPRTITRKASLERVTVYISGENLLTVTKLPDMFDPEGVSGDIGPGKIYPISKAFSIGMNVTF